MIGEVITNPEDGTHSSCGYLVRRNDNDGIEIYRVVEHADTREELEREGDLVAEMYDHVEAGVEAGYIAPPEDGWGGEMETIPESIWGGWG
jgi:hypothetical protein